MQRRFEDQEASARKEVTGFPRGTRTEVLWADKKEEGKGKEEEEKQTNTRCLPYLQNVQREGPCHSPII